ncbi:MAG: radical SAM protein, partial [Planctomycetota bacterium]
MVDEPIYKPLTSILVKPAGPDCNLRCEYCFYLEKATLFQDSPKHRMELHLLEEMIRQCMNQGDQRISFGWQGGEPTLMGLDFFEKAVECQKRFGLNQIVGNGLQTNGILIDAAWTRFLSQYQFLVGLSLDGPEPIHDRYRRRLNGHGTWARVRNSARRMLDAGVAVNALVVLNDYSVRFPEEIYGFHKDLGLTYMQFIPVVRGSASGGFGSPFAVTPEQYGTFLCAVFDLWIGDFDQGIPTTSIRYFDAVFHAYVGMPPPECTLLRECGTYVVVEHNGDVYACDFFVTPEWKLGNILR